jgi:predicted membrane-bound dolichyl-phosphate-mannose-protein mannosyltransferase
VFWKITGQFAFTQIKRVKLLSLLMLNPFVWQMLIIDAHNDVFLVLGICVSFYYCNNRRYAASIFSLLLAGLVKYVTWFLIPIPLYYWLKQQNKKRLKQIGIVCGVIIGAVVLISLAYTPFGFSLKTLTGITTEMTTRANKPYYTIGTYLFNSLLPLTVAQTRLVGIIIAIIIMYWLTRKQKTIYAYTVPFIIIWLIGTTWFQPWYVLWILPLLLLYVSDSVIIILTMALLLTPTTQRPLEMSTIFVGVLGVYLFSKYLSGVILKRYRITDHADKIHDSTDNTT